MDRVSRRGSIVSNLICQRKISLTPSVNAGKKPNLGCGMLTLMGLLSHRKLSTVVTPATAGWGAMLFIKGQAYETCGPVVLQPGVHFRGAERATYNTGEASALLFLLQWALENLQYFDVFLIFTMTASMP